MTTGAMERAPGSITPRVALRLTEWSSIGPGADGDARLLAGLSLGDASTRRLADTLARQGVVSISEMWDGLRVEARSFVGRVVVGPLDLTIVPKVAWSQWLTLFGYALRLRKVVRSERAPIAVAPASLHDLIVLELVAEARDLLARGLHRDYVRHRRSLAAPRGRIDFDRIARQGGIYEAAVPCRFTRRSDDSPLNQALLAGLRSAARIAADAPLKGDARRLAHDLEGTVSAVRLSGELLDAARRALDRRTERYAAALRLLELLWNGQSLTLENHPERPQVPLPGFALDMNQLWQRLLFRVLNEWGEGFEVREEFPLHGLFSRDPAYSPRRRVTPMPRPDYAVFRDGKLLTFLDAKYRDLWEQSLPREMLYQLALYSMAHGNGTATMLYPTDAPDAAEERLRVQEPATGAVRSTVGLRPVRLAQMEKLIAMGQSEQRAGERRAFVSRLLGI